MEISKNIFRGYDLRGTVPEEIDENVAREIGKGFATLMKRAGNKEIIVGRDARLSGKSLRDALCEGIVSTGMNVIDIVCTPYRYVGNGNRYYVDSNTQYRLADRTWWDICDGDLHLQKVITLDCGANLSHNYPDTSEEDILKEVMKIIKKG